jgi:hypothetical protein
MISIVALLQYPSPLDTYVKYIVFLSFSPSLPVPVRSPCMPQCRVCRGHLTVMSLLHVILHFFLSCHLSSCEYQPRKCYPLTPTAGKAIQSEVLRVGFLAWSTHGSIIQGLAICCMEEACSVAGAASATSGLSGSGLGRLWDVVGRFSCIPTHVRGALDRTEGFLQAPSA